MAHLNISVTMNMVENMFNPVLLAVWIIGCVAGLWWNLATTPSEPEPEPVPEGED